MTKTMTKTTKDQINKNLDSRVKEIFENQNFENLKIQDFQNKLESLSSDSNENSKIKNNLGKIFDSFLIEKLENKTILQKISSNGVITNSIKNIEKLENQELFTILESINKNKSNGYLRTRKNNLLKIGFESNRQKIPFQTLKNNVFNDNIEIAKMALDLSKKLKSKAESNETRRQKNEQAQSAWLAREQKENQNLINFTVDEIPNEKITESLIEGQKILDKNYQESHQKNLIQEFQTAFLTFDKRTQKRVLTELNSSLIKD